MALLLSQLHGLGQAEIIAAIVGPLATGGADAYRTYAEADFSKKELKQRQKEFASMSDLERARFEAANQARIIAQHAAVQQKAIQGAWWERNLPLIVGGTVLAVLAVAAATSGRKS
jgi:hypothetical protein